MGSIAREVLGSTILVLKNLIISYLILLASEFTIDLDQAEIGLFLSNSIKILLAANLIFKIIREVIKILKKKHEDN